MMPLYDHHLPDYLPINARLSSLYLLSLVIIILFLTGCSKSNSSDTQTPTVTTDSANITTNTTTAATNHTTKTSTTNSNLAAYVVATNKDFKPFDFRGEDAQMTGFDVDLLNAIAQNQKFQLTFIVVPTEQQFADLKAQKFDILASGITATNELKKQVDFSRSYFRVKQAVIALPETAKIDKFQQLKDYKIAIQPHSISEKLLTNEIKIPSDNLVFVDTPYHAIEAVIQKKADYAMADTPILQYYNRELKEHNLQIYSDGSDETQYYVFAFAKDRDDDLLEKVNTGLANLQADGTYKNIYNKWF